ncbi:MAG: hypothetical protein ACKVX7_16190 [Planctomycetota bacterium]
MPIVRALDFHHTLGALGRGVGVTLGVWPLVIMVLILGPVYGAFMGSYEFETVVRLKMLWYSAIKVPLLIFATSLVCLPGFFVFNTVAGLRTEFSASLRAILAGQAALAAALAALGPLTRVIYSSGVAYQSALLVNAGMFAAATLVGHRVMMRHYAPLIGRDARHRLMVWLWVTLYAFVGIQMGWMLRPFIGAPNVPVTFFREEKFTNAYVFVTKLIVHQF